MASTSALLNRSLRARVTPELREAGFEKVDARNGWRWCDNIVLVFKIRAVGNHFSVCTGWPPGSIGVWLGAFYPFAPSSPVKRDDKGRLLPAEYQCHMRSHLDCGLDQTVRVRSLQNRGERQRRDIWWVEPDGSNAEGVASDVAASLSKDGLAWFDRVSDLRATLSMVERERDCLWKYERAAAISEKIGDQERFQRYRALKEAESKRIGWPR